MIKNLFKLCCALLFSAQVSSATVTIVADEWPPFSSESLTEKGLSTHVVSAVLKRAGFDVSVEILPWARIINGAKNNEFDIIANVFYSPEIAEVMNYSDSYFSTDIVLVKQKNAEINFSDLRSLVPYSIAVGDGFLYTPEFDSASFLNKVTTTTTLQGIQMVAHKRVDLTVDSIHVLKHTIANSAPELEDKIEYIDKALGTHPLFMTVSKKTAKSKEILQKFNATLALMKEDGSYQKIIDSHIK